MKKNLLYLVLFIFAFEAKATISLDVKIKQNIDGNIVETTKKISSNYNEDIVISDSGLQHKIILKLQKIPDIEVNGNLINPVQIDLKLVDGLQKTIGKPHTVTSFYNKSADFTLPSSGVINGNSDLNISLNFKEN